MMQHQAPNLILSCLSRQRSRVRAAILRAAVREIAEAGLGAPTAKIARRTGDLDLRDFAPGFQ